MQPLDSNLDTLSSKLRAYIWEGRIVPFCQRFVFKFGAQGDELRQTRIDIIYVYFGSSTLAIVIVIVQWPKQTSRSRHMTAKVHKASCTSAPSSTLAPESAEVGKIQLAEAPTKRYNSTLPIQMHQLTHFTPSNVKI